ncbi:MAG: threonylcarbamoyl-AMP synthase [Lachnospiraceae bacterium]|nr:threonylcarbamoyl-AMP synthase [Lachnospiraceae bacterium]
METKWIKMLEDKPDMVAVKEAGHIIKKGGLVAFPTETVYGLGGDGLNQEASQKIYAAKGRPSDNPLIIHIADRGDLKRLVKEMPAKAEQLADAFWPGPLTMIFQKSDEVPWETTGGLSTVAVRFPNHPVALAFIKESGGFVAAPSANTSGRPSPTLGSHVYEDLQGKIEMLLDSGEVGIGIESTIIDMTVEPPMILRPGFITEEMLSEVIGSIAVDKTTQKQMAGMAPKAPGMKYRHYAPKGELTIVSGSGQEVKDRINMLLKAAKEKGLRTGVIGTEENMEFYHADIKMNAGKKADELTAARRLYGILREFDEKQVDVIYSEAFPGTGVGQAVMNRLLKAAGHKVIQAGQRGEKDDSNR